MTSNTKARSNRIARPRAIAAANPASLAKPLSKLDQVEALLIAGASIAELMAATGWQQHSVRGAMAGALKKRGLAISSDEMDGVRRYRAVRA